MSEEGFTYVVRVGEKTIEINEEVLEVLRRYVRQEFSLEQLAAELGLEDWEEAYEFVKKIPAWMLWVPPTLWRTMRAMRTAKEEMRARS